MTHTPTSTQPVVPGEGIIIPWAQAEQLLAAANTFWLVTVRPDGRPHVMPLLAVWLDGALHFAAGAATRKARNLARDPRCVITTDSGPLHMVVEGTAERVTAEPELRRLAEVYAEKYRWPVDVRGAAFYADGAPTAGPPPYELYRLAPSVIFGFPADGTLPATRWQFSQSEPGA